MQCRDWRGGILAAALFLAAGLTFAADSQVTRRDSVPRLLRAIEFSDYGSAVVRFGDLNSDGQTEVVHQDPKSLLTILEGKSGKQKRQVQLAGGFDCLLFADLTGSGRAQQLVVKDRYFNFWVYDAAQDFKLLWSQAKVPTGHYPINADFNGVPMALRAAKGDEDALVARAFSRPCRHSCRHAFDRVFKGDGKDELLVGYPLYAPDGKILWAHDEFPTGRSHNDAVDVKDMDGDGRPEITIAATEDGFLLDADGKVLFRKTLDHAQHALIGRFRPELYNNTIYQGRK